MRLHGRMAALLELGMGFHGEFTGRQNVMLSGQLLGIERHELEALMPAIEEFAEIGDVLRRTPAHVFERHGDAARVQPGHRAPARRC